MSETRPPARFFPHPFNGHPVLASHLHVSTPAEITFVRDTMKKLIVLLAIVLPLAVCASAQAGIDITVSRDSSFGSLRITTPGFSTSAGNELLLAFVATDSVSSGMQVQNVTGAGLTWTLVRRSNSQLGTAEVWRAFAPSPLAGVSVTANLSRPAAASISVMSFTGVDTRGTNGSGAIGATAGNSASSGAPIASLTTTRANSWVLGVGNDWDNAIPRTVGSGQTLVHQYLASVGDTYWVQRRSTPSTPSGTVVALNDIWPSGDRYNLSIVEVLPANASVAPAPLTISSQSLPNGTAGSAYSTTLSASGGNTPYKWSLAAGSLPPGVSLSAGGVVSG